MGYRNLQECVADLQATGQLVAIDEPIDARLEAAAIHRRVFAAGGPALLFRNVRDCRFPMVSNLFGTRERIRYLFRDALARVETLVRMKADPVAALRQWTRGAAALRGAWHTRPKLVRHGPVTAAQARVSDLPQLVSWPQDGGAYVTLPQVYSEDPRRPGVRHSNLGMYRVQLSGGKYTPNEEVGLHYQIHRGIGVHHAAAIARGEPLRVNVVVGGPPALTLAAVMPLPEGLPEWFFAGLLGGRRLSLVTATNGLPMPAEADFVISGYIDPDKQLPEGPFGDHLGYYSLAHDFPVMRVQAVHHRTDAIWPFTVVGRPPQEDTMFGDLIHELTGPAIPTVIAGVQAVHAVDATGVHPLLLAIGSERYTPYTSRSRPQELLTQANAILGQGQLSLAKYLLIVAAEDAPALDVHDIAGFLAHLLARADWTRDLHFQTETTIDTLDYSGSGLNAGSKLVIAAVGPQQHELACQLSGDAALPDGFSEPRVFLPGVLAVRGPAFTSADDDAVRRFCEAAAGITAVRRFRLVVVVDDSEFVARSLENLLWVTFTRSDPAVDVDGVDAFTQHKHWGCRGPLVIDARCKPHHAPPLEEDPEVTARVESLASRGGPLAGII
ncbi:MAG: UbiD family decarboxylase [Planctomycetales bacterium]|nr:UbiD family decarboxylase [Planctomycetales bacterium]